MFGVNNLRRDVIEGCCTVLPFEVMRIMQHVSQLLLYPYEYLSFGHTRALVTASVTTKPVGHTVTPRLDGTLTELGWSAKPSSITTLSAAIELSTMC